MVDWNDVDFRPVVFCYKGWGNALMVREMHSGSSRPDEAEIKRRQWRLLLIIVGVLAAITVAIVGLPVAFVLLLGCHNKTRIDKLLNDVDHSSVVVAVHRMLEDERFAGQERIYLRGSDPNLPTEIRSLEPTDVSVGARYVRIEFGGGFHHFGFLIFPPDEEPEPWRISEYTKMSDGIWFYEDE